jgi:hypothetical protein
VRGERVEDREQGRTEWLPELIAISWFSSNRTSLSIPSREYLNLSCFFLPQAGSPPKFFEQTQRNNAVPPNVFSAMSLSRSVTSFPLPDFSEK